MTATWINRLGNWNPQFLRECRGRLKFRSVLAAILVSAIVQILACLGVWSDSVTNNWRQVFEFLSYLFPYALFVAGSYTLISDISEEEQRGTLDFIRLSPRSSQTILLGKLLGVPILPYLSIALAIPLHLVSGILAPAPLELLLSYYLILIAATIFLFNLSLLVALLGSAQMLLANRQAPTAISFSVLSFIFFTPMFTVWNGLFVWSHFGSGESGWFGFVASDRPVLHWIYLPISENSWFIHAFTLFNLGIGIYFLWQVLQRRFQNPSATVLSKRQSYAVVAYLEILALGFFLDANLRSYEIIASLTFIYTFNFILFLVLIAVLSPQRQVLLDWHRYDRHPHGIWRDLIWAEKSPAPIAIVINLIIAYALIIPWLLVNFKNEYQTIGLSVFLALAGIILIYAVIVQRIFATKIRNPTIWAAGTMASLLILPPITLGILELPPNDAPLLWTFFGLPFVEPKLIAEAKGEIWSGLIAQWIVLGVFGFQLKRFLQRTFRT